MARSRSFEWNSPTTSSISIIKEKQSVSLFFHPFLGSGVILVDQNILRSQRRSFFITKKTNFCILLTFCESFILLVSAALLKQLNPLVTFWFSLVLIFLVSTQLSQTNKIVGKLVKEVDTSQHCYDVTQWMVLA